MSTRSRAEPWFRVPGERFAREEGKYRRMHPELYFEAAMMMPWEPGWWQVCRAYTFRWQELPVEPIYYEPYE